MEGRRLMSKLAVRWIRCSEVVNFSYDVHIRVYHKDFNIFSQAIIEVLRKIAQLYNAKIPQEEEKKLSPDRLKELINTRVGEVTSITISLVRGRPRAKIGELFIRPGGLEDTLFLTTVQGWVRRNCKGNHTNSRIFWKVDRD